MTSDKDIFRETPVRYLGYANEVGESFRGVISNNLVIASYLVSIGYVGADCLSKVVKTWRAAPPDSGRTKEALKEGVDSILWQSFATIIIPGFTINRIVKASRYTFAGKPYCRWISVGVGLASIPFIIKPIDHAVDWAMDSTVRPLLRKI